MLISLSPMEPLTHILVALPGYTVRGYHHCHQFMKAIHVLSFISQAPVHEEVCLWINYQLAATGSCGIFHSAPGRWCWKGEAESGSSQCQFSFGSSWLLLIPAPWKPAASGNLWVGVLPGSGWSIPGEADLPGAKLGSVALGENSIVTCRLWGLSLLLHYDPNSQGKQDTLWSVHRMGHRWLHESNQKAELLNSVSLRLWALAFLPGFGDGWWGPESTEKCFKLWGGCYYFSLLSHSAAGFIIRTLLHFEKFIKIPLYWDNIVSVALGCLPAETWENKRNNFI